MDVAEDLSGPDTAVPEPGSSSNAFPRPAVALIYFTFFMTFGAVHWFIVPKFKEIYEQLKVPIPRGTEMLFEVSEVACTYPAGWVALGVFFGLTIAYLTRPQRWVTTLVLWLVIFSVGFIVWGLFSPLLGGITSVSRR